MDLIKEGHHYIDLVVAFLAGRIRWGLYFQKIYYFLEVVQKFTPILRRSYIIGKKLCYFSYHGSLYLLNLALSNLRSGMMWTRRVFK